jgi:hypothetical protein
MMQNGQMYTNKQLEEGMPLMAAPLYYQNLVAAVIAIDGMKFESFSLYQQNLFQITTDLIASSLNKAFTFIEATENNRYIEGTKMMQPAVFKEIVNAKHEAKVQHHIPYLLLQCSLNRFSSQEAAQFIEPLLRETDYVGLTEERQLQILLSNTTEQDLDIIMPRLSHPQISFTVVSEE